MPDLACHARRFADTQGAGVAHPPVADLPARAAAERRGRFAGLQIDRSGRRVIARLDGDLTIASAVALRPQLLDLLGVPRRGALVLDLARVQAIDLSGLQLLLALQRQFGRSIRLVHLSPAIVSTLTLLRLGSRFEEMRRMEAAEAFAALLDADCAPVQPVQAAWLQGIDTWHLSLRFDPDVMRLGMDPIGFLAYLEALGEFAHVAVVDDRLPGLGGLDPETCYLGLEIDLRSDAGADEVLDAVGLVDLHACARVLPPGSSVARYVELAHALPEGPKRMGGLLCAAGVLTRAEWRTGVRAFRASSRRAKR